MYVFLTQKVGFFVRPLASNHNPLHCFPTFQLRLVILLREVATVVMRSWSEPAFLYSSRNLETPPGKKYDMPL